MERVKEILRIIISPSGATIAICATLIILRNSINGLTERLITSRRGKAKFGPVEVDFEEPPEQIQRDVPKSKEPEPESSKETETPVTEQEAKPLLNQVFDLLYAENNYQEAQKFFHEQVEPKLDEDEKLVWKAVILRISSEIGDSNALDKLKTIVKENETNPKLIRQLALRYRDMGLFEKSKEQFLLAKDNLDINDKSQRDLIVDCYIGSSMCLANNNEYIDAINMLKQTLRKNEFQAQRAKILRAMANIAKDNNESDDFICYAELALNTNPLDIDIRFSIAYVYNEMGNGKLALLHYKQLLDISTNHAVALNNLGVCYSNLKLKAKSINSYLRSAEEKETLDMSNLAFNYLDAGFIKNAKELIDRANKLSAEGIEVNPRIGSVSGKLKDLKEEEEKGETKFLKEAERERKFVTVHGYFECIEQRTQCQNAHFQLDEL